MKRFIIIIKLLFLIAIANAQNDSVINSNKGILICIDTINGVKIYKRVSKELMVVDGKIISDKNKENSDYTNIDKDTYGEQIIPDINHVELKDLPKAKRFDELWYKKLYQPVLFDSIQNINTEVLDKSDPINIDTKKLEKQIEFLNQKTQLQISYNPVLARTVQVFLNNRKESLARLFKVAEYYFPIFEEKLSKYNIPLEMKYLAIVESALHPRAISKVGAGGLWQFMYSTGKMYGLEINTYVDDRFDPIKSTEAACKHMQDLYKVFKDWNLVLAAYNSGAGNVTKAIRRSGGYTNYWNIRPYLPRETAGYVPLFQATLLLGEYADEYGIVYNNKDKEEFHYIPTDTIQIKQTITFQYISKLLHVDIKELEFLNPQYKLNIIPYVEGKNYTLKLPVDLVGVFVNNENFIYDIVRKELDKREKPLPKFYKFNNYLVYKVRAGDNLGKIAKKFRVSISKIKRWNRLRTSVLRIGQKLKIYSRRAYAISSKKKHLDLSRKKYKSRLINYKVKVGDTLWNISKKYNISIHAIRKWNNLKKNNKLKPGMILKIFSS